VDLSENAARALTSGARFPDEHDPRIEIVGLGDPEPARYAINGTTEAAAPDRWQRRVLARVRCEVQVFEQVRNCLLPGGVPVAPGQMVTSVSSTGTQSVVVELVLPDREPERVDMRVRFVGYPGVIDFMRVGDTDRGHFSLDGRGAVLTALGGRRQMTGSVSVGLGQEGLGVSADLQAIDQVTALDVTLRLGLDQLSGWRYRGDPVRVGGPITFMTPSYVVRGIVLGIDSLSAAPHGTNGAAR
jgi:hypothetical protein